MSCSEHRRFHRFSNYRLDMLNSDMLPAMIKNVYLYATLVKLRDCKTMPWTVHNSILFIIDHCSKTKLYSLFSQNWTRSNIQKI